MMVNFTISCPLTAHDDLFFMFIAFECFARRVVIIDDKNYPKARFRGVFSGN